MAFNSYGGEFHFVSIKDLLEQKIGAFIVPEIFKEAGHKIIIEPLPARRAQASAKRGKSDGEIMRIYNYGIENPEVIRVPTPYYNLKTTPFFRKNSKLKVNRIDDLKNFKVSKTIGVKHTNNLTLNLKPEGVINVNSTEQMMKALTNGRADIALTSAVEGRAVVKKLGISDYVVEGKTLATQPLYIYVHKKNTKLVSELNKAILRLKKSGRLKKYN